MKIFIDIGHPAHVHYFRNFIKLMQEKGNEIFVTARNRSIIHYLLKYYNIPFYDRGKGSNDVLGKLFYMLVADMRLLRKALKFKPDLFISFASPYAAQVSRVRRTPHIAIDDTEHATLGHIFYKPFSSVFLNPSCFKRDFGSKQIRFNSFTELFYLHTNYYKPDEQIYSLLNIEKDQKYVLLRFVSWHANHDIGHSGLNHETKNQLIELLLDKGFKVFISSESDKIEPEFEPFVINVPPERIHDILNFCSLFISESGTMASEAAVLGTPVVYVNSLPLMGYLEEEQRCGLLFHFPSSENVTDKVKEILSIPDPTQLYKTRSKKMLEGKIDITAFLIWFIENYPSSVTIMKENPGYQDRFR